VDEVCSDLGSAFFSLTPFGTRRGNWFTTHGATFDCSQIGTRSSNSPRSAIESFSVYDSARDDRNTRLRGRFRIACGSGECSEARIQLICGSSYPQQSESGPRRNAPDHLELAFVDEQADVLVIFVDEQADTAGINRSARVGVDNAPPASLTTIRPRHPIILKYFEDGKRHSTIGNYP
jgi:hypothetical protein